MAATIWAVCLLIVDWPRGDVWVEEEYTCEANGGVKVRISDKMSDFASEFRLGKWARNGKPTKDAISERHSSRLC